MPTRFRQLQPPTHLPRRCRRARTAVGSEILFMMRRSRVWCCAARFGAATLGGVARVIGKRRGLGRRIATACITHHFSAAAHKTSTHCDSRASAVAAGCYEKLTGAEARHKSRRVGGKFSKQKEAFFDFFFNFLLPYQVQVRQTGTESPSFPWLISFSLNPKSQCR